MTKSELRKKYKALRNAYTEQQLDAFSIEIANKTLELPVWNKSCFHLFLPIKTQNEVNTEYVLQILAGKDKDVVISKSNFEKIEMTHFLLTDNTKIVLNQYNIPEPVNGFEVSESKIDVVFIPLLAFDIKGNRVGYGKGFYDAFLTKCKPSTIKIGLSFFEAETIIKDNSPMDIPLDYCVTPEKVYLFKKLKTTNNAC